ncbi:MAG: hypothetical protein RLN90_01590 [Balneolaceae bacterium]
MIKKPKQIKSVLNREKNAFDKVFDSFLFVIVQVFLTFIALHGKSLSAEILNSTESSFIFNDIFQSAYNNLEGWLLILVFPLFTQFLRYSRLTLTDLGLLGSAAGVFVCCFYLIYFDVKSPIIFLTLGFQYAIGVVVVGVDKILQFEHEASFWELIFSTISRLVGFIIILYGAGSAILQFVSEGTGEPIEGYLSSFLYPTIIIVGILFMIGYWILIPTLMKIHEAKKLESKREIRSIIRHNKVK